MEADFDDCILWQASFLAFFCPCGALRAFRSSWYRFMKLPASMPTILDLPACFRSDLRPTYIGGGVGFMFSR